MHRNRLISSLKPLTKLRLYCFCHTKPLIHQRAKITKTPPIFFLKYLHISHKTLLRSYIFPSISL